MNSKEAIYDKLVEALVELFELDQNDISPASHLYNDLDIDSIDAVDMVVKLKQMTGKRIEPNDFKNVRTVQDVVDSVHTLMNEDN